MNLYHFSDSARLPWILRSGQLRPGRNIIGDFPQEFLWATTSHLGDPTATSALSVQYKSGDIYLVRFTVDADDFFPWAEVPDRFPAWTKDHVAALERVKKGADPSRWWCRADALSLDDVSMIDARSYADGRWREVDRTVHEVHQGNEKWLGTSFSGRQYYSAHRTNPNGTDGYSVGKGQ